MQISLRQQAQKLKHTRERLSPHTMEMALYQGAIGGARRGGRQRVRRRGMADWTGTGQDRCCTQFSAMSKATQNRIRGSNLDQVMPSSSRTGTSLSALWS